MTRQGLQNISRTMLLKIKLSTLKQKNWGWINRSIESSEPQTITKHQFQLKATEIHTKASLNSWAQITKKRS